MSCDNEEDSPELAAVRRRSCLAGLVARSAASTPGIAAPLGSLAVTTGCLEVLSAEVLRAISAVEHDLSVCGYLRMQAIKDFLPVILAAARRQAESMTERQPPEHLR